MKPTRIFLSMILFLAFLEGFARVTYHFMPLEVHQRYLISQEQNDFDRHNNARGAVGDIYRGQKIKIAVFGLSPSLMFDVPYKEKWSHLLQEILGTENVHVDNFSIGYNGTKAIAAQMKSLNRLGYHYDVILVGLALKRSSLDNQLTEYFSSRWHPEQNSFLKFPGLFSKFYQRRKSKEWLLQTFFPETKWGVNELVTSALNGNDVYSEEARQDPRIIKKLVKIETPDFSQGRLESFSQEVDEVQRAAAKLGDQILWFPVRLAWNPAMKSLPPLEFIRPIPEFNKDQPEFYDYESLYKYFDKRAQAVVKVLNSKNLAVLDWPQTVNDCLAVHDELYIDEFHLSPKGGIIAAKSIARKIAPLIQLELEIDKTVAGDSLKKDKAGNDQSRQCSLDKNWQS